MSKMRKKQTARQREAVRCRGVIDLSFMSVSRVKSREVADILSHMSVFSDLQGNP